MPIHERYPCVVGPRALDHIGYTAHILGQFTRHPTQDNPRPPALPTPQRRVGLLVPIQAWLDVRLELMRRKTADSRIMASPSTTAMIPAV